MAEAERLRRALDGTYAAKAAAQAAVSALGEATAAELEQDAAFLSGAFSSELRRLLGLSIPLGLPEFAPAAPGLNDPGADGLRRSDREGDTAPPGWPGPWVRQGSSTRGGDGERAGEDAEERRARRREAGEEERPVAEEFEIFTEASFSLTDTEAGGERSRDPATQTEPGPVSRRWEDAEGRRARRREAEEEERREEERRDAEAEALRDARVRELLEADFQEAQREQEIRDRIAADLRERAAAQATAWQVFPAKAPPLFAFSPAPVPPKAPAAGGPAAGSAGGGPPGPYAAPLPGGDHCAGFPACGHFLSRYRQNCAGCGRVCPVSSCVLKGPLGWGHAECVGSAP